MYASEENNHQYWQGYYAAARGALTTGWRTLAWRDGYAAYRARYVA